MNERRPAGRREETEEERAARVSPDTDAATPFSGNQDRVDEGGQASGPEREEAHPRNTTTDHP